ncbi:LuxR C-terminal-related transcriptional regulator [Actinomadura fulvescens]|uniref:LuxR C-terminal-related transcriptional regulator n=1 Tax=Actinomadura fulvescens TaxID=46160 RepID=UPI0031DE054B
MTQVALRSPNRLLREALATSLATRPDLAVIGATERLSDLLWLCRLRPADVVLIDLGSEFAEADLEGVHALRATSRTLAIVLTYTRLSPDAVTAAGRAGATRLVPHSRGIQAVIEAVVQGPAPPRDGPPALLTDRDLQVLALMSAGYSVKEMARLMGVSTSTIENHKRRMFAKLSAHSQAHVVARAARMGLLWSAPRGTAPPRLSRARVVLVIGAPGELRDTVVLTLLRHAIPVMMLGRGTLTAEDELMRFRELITTVLISGPDSDWRAVRHLGTRTVTVIAGTEQPTIAEELIRGADAVVPAGDVPEQLAFVVALASQGYATTDAAREMIRSMAARFPSVRASLTAREIDILRSIASGHSVRQTAAALGITSKTVENTQARLFRKLSVRNRAEALAVAYSLGLITHD